MRRLMPIAAFALFLAVPVWAQHGGGHGGGGFGGRGGSGGGHGGGFSGHAGFGGGHIGGGHFSGSMRSARGVSRGFNRGPSFSRSFSNRPFLHDRFRRSPRFRTYGFRNNCYGYGCWGGYGYPWWGYYDPWWWDSDSGSWYDEDYERDRAVANDMNERSLEEQQMRREEEAQEYHGPYRNDRDSYARQDSAPHPSESATTIVPATVLVFRDQHQQEIRNYAIVGQTLWNFAPQHTEKIPLANLDLAATTKANDDRGLTFVPPAASEAQ